MKSDFLSISKLTLTILALYGSALYSDDSYRTFTDSQGRLLDARIQSTTETSVHLKDRQGRIFEVPVEMLSPQDQDFIRSNRNTLDQSSIADVITAESPLQTRLNHLAGKPVFIHSNLWSISADQIASVLNCKMESQTDFSASFRLYPDNNYIFFGANPNSVAVYGGEDGNLTSISVIYANKGDFNARLKEFPPQQLYGFG